MKQIATLLFVLLAGQTQAGKVNDFVTCEDTGSCAPAPAKKNSKSFVAQYDADSLYSYTEQDNIKQEIAKAQEFMDAKRQQEKMTKQCYTLARHGFEIILMNEKIQQSESNEGINNRISTSK